MTPPPKIDRRNRPGQRQRTSQDRRRRAADLCPVCRGRGFVVWGDATMRLVPAAEGTEGATRCTIEGCGDDG